MGAMSTTTEPDLAAQVGATPSATDVVAVRDGTELLVRRWRAAGPAWATLLVVHGLAEHSGRYEHVGRQLAAAGIATEAYDQRGFGGSGGRRAYVDRWSQVHDDLEERLTAVRSSAGGRPVILYGHSLGGLIALGYAVADPARPLADALVLSAPALESTIPVWKQALARGLGAVAPTRELGNDLDGAVLSRDPTVAERYLADPLCHHASTFRFGAEALAEQARVRAALSRLSVPALVYHGEADGLVPTSASEPLGALPGVVRRTYPGLRHETHNEPEGPTVIADVIAWLRATVRSAAGA
jgi:alpha-beta hydrolase superfamily lysophospholipase